MKTKGREQGEETDNHQEVGLPERLDFWIHKDLGLSSLIKGQRCNLRCCLV